MAESYMIPPMFAKLHPQHKTPINALFLIGALTMLAPLAGPVSYTHLDVYKRQAQDTVASYENLLKAVEAQQQGNTSNATNALTEVNTEALSVDARAVYDTIYKSMQSTIDVYKRQIHDWCISRQLWWGHRIPAYTCDDCGEITVVRGGMPEKCPKCGSTHLIQDPDTLDTWFSSALWPFSTLGWPEKTPEFDYFYPTDVLVTGYDIIFFWVIRMVFSRCV